MLLNCSQVTESSLPPFFSTSCQWCPDLRCALNLPPVMDSKKPGVLRHLRQKMMPHLRRGKTSTNKSPTLLEPSLDHRSSSVPDIRQEYSGVSSITQLQQHNTCSHSNPTSPLLMSSKRHLGGGSGLNMGVVGSGAGRREYRLSVPLNGRDHSSSQESFSSLCVDERSSPETHYRRARGMEPEELVLPEVMTIYSPDVPTVEVSQHTSEVQKHMSYVRSGFKRKSSSNTGNSLKLTSTVSASASWVVVAWFL